MNGNGNSKKQIIDSLIKSPIFRDYERSFGEATGLPVALISPESWQLPFRGHRKENRFCALMSSHSRSCAACLEAQGTLTAGAACATRTITCAAGLSETAVPVRVGEQLVGFLRTGQVFRHSPTAKQFDRMMGLAKCWGLPADERELRAAYFDTPVLPLRRHDSVVQLLNIFAQHLSMLSNHLLIQRANTEPPMIARARAFIEEHHTEPLSLTQVAAEVHASTFYFCKMFKKVTGLNFTVFVSRVRVEKAKILLLNFNLRISEIAYEVGFQSLTHFNRVFKTTVGESPTAYRTRVPKQLRY